MKKTILGLLLSGLLTVALMVPQVKAVTFDDLLKEVTSLKQQVAQLSTQLYAATIQSLNASPELIQARLNALRQLQTITTTVDTLQQTVPTTTTDTASIVSIETPAPVELITGDFDWDGDPKHNCVRVTFSENGGWKRIVPGNWTKTWPKECKPDAIAVTSLDATQFLVSSNTQSNPLDHAISGHATHNCVHQNGSRLSLGAFNTSGACVSGATVASVQQVPTLSSQTNIQPTIQTAQPVQPPTYSPARYGQTSDAVRILQEALIRKGYLTGNATGYYGNLTVAALKNFQLTNGINDDGTAFGPKSIAALQATSTPSIAQKPTGSDTAGMALAQYAINGGCNAYEFVTKWGQDGTRAGDFNVPMGIATDSVGNVYVTDHFNNRVQKFTSSGQFITQWGTQGSGNGQLYFPAGIAVDSVGNVYVADRVNNRIQKFTSNGQYITQWGTFGTGNGQFSALDGITVDSLGNVYAVDIGLGNPDNRIQKFTSNGQFITEWGDNGSGNGQFSIMGDIATDSMGNVYIVDVLNNRIQKFTSNGIYITQWGTQGSGNGQFANLKGIDVDTFGNVYVTDAGNQRIQKFTSTGTYISQFEVPGLLNGQTYSPLNDIEVDLSGNVYVTDTGNFRVQKFSPKCKTPVFPVPTPVSINPNIFPTISPSTLPPGCTSTSGYSPLTGAPCDTSKVVVTPVIAPVTISKPCLAATAPWIQVLAPNGGETFTAGQTIDVKWKSCNVPATDLVYVDLFGDVGATTLGFGFAQSYVGHPAPVAGDGSYTIIFPTQTQWPALQSGFHYKMLVGDPITGAQDASDNLFTINQ